MYKLICQICLIFFSILLVACSSVPVSFVRNQPSSWVAIELSDAFTKEVAWGKVSDALKERDLEFEKIDKDAGYMRTAWRFQVIASGLFGTQKEKVYATRVIVDFPSNGKTIRIKTEAQYKEDGNWLEGFDTNYNQTIKSELTSIIGRK